MHASSKWAKSMKIAYKVHMEGGNSSYRGTMATWHGSNEHGWSAYQGEDPSTEAPIQIKQERSLGGHHTKVHGQVWFQKKQEMGSKI